jgi:hypothetical protein
MRSEYDDGGDDRTPLQKDYGARTGKHGDAEGATFAGLLPLQERGAEGSEGKPLPENLR